MDFSSLKQSAVWMNSLSNSIGGGAELLQKQETDQLDDRYW